MLFRSSWVIDSGASSHMFDTKFLFSNLHSVKHHILLADGSSRSVLGKCVLHPTSSLALPSSLYVPNFPFNHFLLVN